MVYENIELLPLYPIWSKDQRLIYQCVARLEKHGTKAVNHGIHEIGIF